MSFGFKYLLFAVVLLIPSFAYANRFDSLLLEVDKAIEQRADFDSQKESYLAKLKHDLSSLSGTKDKFEALGNIFNQYLYYNTDSAHRYAAMRHDLAVASGNKSFIPESAMNLAAVNIITGMYGESLDVLNGINPGELSDALKLYRFTLLSALYEALHNFSVTSREQENYLSLSNSYRDSILSVSLPSSSDFVYNQAHRLMTAGNCSEAAHMLESHLEEITGHNRDKAITTYLLYDVYRCLGDLEKANGYLALSALCDIKSSTKEYISLWTLAGIIYEQGNFDRAYRYLRCSLDDATFSKARLRTIEISGLFGLVENAYQKNRERQHQRMVVMLAVISLLLIVVVGAVIFSRSQVKKLRVVQRDLAFANQRLTELNGELELNNLNVLAANRSLQEANAIKEVYLGRYMDFCSEYIDKMDDYRRTLSRKASGGNIAGVVDDLKSTQAIKKELKEFYTNFDHTFLKLFPDFIARFNDLLMPGEQIVLKSNELLNSELRVFALIRLGITDSEKIAGFLRYSVTTIYNYRTKMRNKALGDRNDFDRKVMMIGK
jgi:competence protein ComGC